MRTLATFACLIALTGGCVSYQASKYTALTGAAALVVGVVVTATEPNTGESDGHAINGREAAAVGLIAAGLVVAIAGVIGMVAHGPPKTAPAP